MPSRFSFKSAKFVDESGLTLALSSAQAKFMAGPRPVRLHLEVAASAGSQQDTTVATLELSRAEAVAFSEWLDTVVTQPPKK